MHETSRIFKLKKHTSKAKKLLKSTLVCYPSLLTGGSDDQNHFPDSQTNPNAGQPQRHSHTTKPLGRNRSPALPAGGSGGTWPTGENLAKLQQPQQLHLPWICHDLTAKILLHLTSGEDICLCKHVTKVEGTRWWWWWQLLWKSYTEIKDVFRRQDNSPGWVRTRGPLKPHLSLWGPLAFKNV